MTEYFRLVLVDGLVLVRLVLVILVDHHPFVSIDSNAKCASSRITKMSRQYTTRHIFGKISLI